MVRALRDTWTMRASWASSAAVRSVMRANKGRDTEPEMRVRRRVHAAGLRYRVNARPLPGSRVTADMLFRRAKVAVFIDGCFWHGCPDHHRPATINAAFWQAKIKENQARDRRAHDALSTAGWIVIRAWEHEDPALVAQRIIELVQAKP